MNSCWDEAGWKAFLCPGMYLVKPFCFMAGMLKTLCQLPARVRDWFMENIANRILAAIDPLIEEFYFQTEFSFQKEMKTTHELSFNHTMLELLQEIRGTVDLFQIYMELVAVLFAMISGFFLIQAVYGAIRYQCGYRTLPTFDNNFITKELEELDRIRSQSGHETILPLTFIESQQYPSAWTLGFRPNEKPRFFIEAMFVASNAIVPTIILALDYAVYVTMVS